MDYRFRGEEIDKAFIWRLFFMFCGIIIIMAASDVWAADTNIKDSDPIGTAMCNWVKLIRGRIAQALAIIAIFVLGVQTLRGQLKWEIGVIILTGIIILFKAPDIVSTISENKMLTDGDKCGKENISVS